MADESDHDKIIRLEVSFKNLGEKIDELKRDKRAGIFAILGLVAKTVFDHFSKGPL